MGAREKAMRAGILFIVILFVSGIVLMYKGNDAVVLAIEKKEGILTAEQVKMSFDSVSGRLIREAVQEGQEVRKGDIIMQLDSTDTDLAIAKLKAQIAQMEAQIQATSGTRGINYMRADSDEQQSFRQIDQQKAAVTAAQATLRNTELDYNRKVELEQAGAIARAELDNAVMSLQVAQANVAQQQQILDKLLSGVQDRGDTDSLNLPTIAQERASADNMANDVEALRQQKKALEVQLQELEVAKKRLVLYAPEDGKILKILAKQGEMVSPNTPVVLLESNRYYYDIYVNEEQAAHIRQGDEITGTSVAGNQKVTGTVRLLTQAPGFADLKQSREKGQADLSAFQVRIYTNPQENVLPGMTIGVTDDEFTEE